MALSPLGIALSEQQPIMPARPGQVAPTDVLSAFGLSSGMAEQQYQAKLAQQNAMWGGLAGLGSAGILAAPKLYSALHPAAAASGATPLASGAATPDLGNLAFDGSGNATGIIGVGPLAGTAGDTGVAATAAGGGVPLAGLAPPATFGGVPLAGLDASSVGAADAGLGADAALDAGTVAGADAAATAAPLAIGAGTDAAAGGAATLADLLPFLFA